MKQYKVVVTDKAETALDKYIGCLVDVKKNEQAEHYAREGLAVDSTQHWIATNLAAALLFQGKYAEAEKIYR